MKATIATILCILLLCGCAGTESTPISLSTEPIQTSTAAPTEPSASEPAPSEAETEPQITETEPSITETPPSITETDPPVTEPPVPEDPIDDYMATLTLEQLVGQLFLARCPESKAIKDIEKYCLGGYILFAPDFENQTPASISAKIENYQSASSIPMFIAVDEEGGKVNRVSKYPAFRNEPFLSPRKLYKNGGLPLVLETEAEKNQLLASLGINVNLAPVCDITNDPDAFMYPRSIGLDAAGTAEYVRQVLTSNQNSGVSNVLKHFPGYGNNTDTHTAIAIDNRTLQELETVDLVPFQAGIDAGCSAIMVSHTFINAIDPTLPATLSPAVHGYLRQEMGFEGVIVTDDMVMQAITDLYGAAESAILAVLAGNDLLISTDYQIQYPAVLTAVEDGTIPLDLIYSAARRVLQWKLDMGILKI